MACSRKVKLRHYIEKSAKEDGISIKEEINFLKEEWGEYGHLGFGFFVSPDTNALHIQKIDEMNVFDSDWDAADYAETLGVKLIPINQIANEYPYNCMRFIDSEENRNVLKNEKVLIEG